ncbi:polysaccharide export protein [Cytophagaceae bacterium SJW1-29]|uniref:Polysaccharide export protein n=2 Tax=Salmonirosea aquatica TaxID=2654236 RepID=A0A7C9FAT5_9BACT|nr:polysaccharide export protein [Cytophagaceae bacterium SJW1-29]
MFQSANQRENTLSLPPVYEQTIKVGDNLSIQINTLSTQASALFNSYAPASQSEQGNLPNSSSTGRGYRVDHDGYITIPVIGKVEVNGLTNSLAETLIQDKLKPQFNELSVSVRNQNFRISVLGEVARPGFFPINSEQITLPEALGLAGDITIYGRRTNVMVIREENGHKTFTKIDMTKRDFFRSSYYYLHSNDVVYVEPSKNRLASTDRIYVIAPLIVGTLTSLAIFFTRF